MVGKRRNDESDNWVDELGDEGWVDLSEFGYGEFPIIVGKIVEVDSEAIGFVGVKMFGVSLVDVGVGGVGEEELFGCNAPPEFEGVRVAPLGFGTESASFREDFRAVIVT